MRNLKLTLAYDGTRYVGWQIQPNGRSIQEVLQQTIRAVTGEEPKLLVAGRTDAGVHALGQVCNFQTESTIPCSGLRAALQAQLPHDIAVREVQDVPLDFHATYSAKRKHYCYVLYNSKSPNPFTRHYAYQYHIPLDVEVMRLAAQHLLGTHDFRCFETQWPNKATSIRTIFRAAVSRHSGCPVHALRELEPPQNVAGAESAGDSQEGDYLWIDLVADGFLYNMVRAIVGTLIRIGRGYWQPEDMRRIIQQQDRSLAGETVPPQGLYLVSVEYPERPASQVDPLHS
jgi:tRNA pseudouridine38-40 synthase